ncbi:FAD-binding protein [Novosphingobium sp.]|uniref:FAD-binding protein n=1 Tax=Novosphingobium sp. TaxID=1874826 RepID=UPI0038F72A0C
MRQLRPRGRGRSGQLRQLAGLATGPHARVLNDYGQPITSLFAAHTETASMMGGHYHAGGINLRSEIVLGYLAALTALKLRVVESA